MFSRLFPALMLPMIACAVYTPEEKVYVELEDLTFDANGIWLKDPVDRWVVGAEAVHFDASGYYVVKNEKKTWVCPKCSRVNPGTGPGVWGCELCGWPFFDTSLD